MVLTELTDAAVNYIIKDDIDKALVLLQKSHGILEIVDFCTKGTCKSTRDQYYSMITFKNMALCYQRLSKLEECAFCLEQCLVNT